MKDKAHEKKIKQIYNFPDNLRLLHSGEEKLYQKSVKEISQDERLLLHLGIIEMAMDVTDVFCQYPTEDEELKVIQMLGMRIFNAFAASLKLMLSGYYQNSTLIMRNILETVFFLDLFETDRTAIKRWRLANKKDRLREFKPVAVRETLDKRDNNIEKKRALMYEAFSGLAGHPNMQSVNMLKPLGMDARNCPFLDSKMLESVLSEMGRLAIQAGEIMNAFFPEDCSNGDASRKAFESTKLCWILKFYGSAIQKEQQP